MRTITATIDPAAITRVSRFFDASDRQIIHEMLQNARRAGATRVDVRTGSGRVSMTDNGRGIADPQTLLSLGTSGWSREVGASECPAGMGFFSLARRNATVESRPTGGDAWRVDLEPEHFTGERAAQVLEAREAPLTQGTRVTFSRTRDDRNIADTIAEAARYGPLLVTVDGGAVEREDFLQHAVRVSLYEGVRIGVFHGTGKIDPKAAGTPQMGNINFHGLAVPCPELPTVRPVSEQGGIGKAWTTAVDIMDCPQLELVLPARHKAVENAFLHTLARACRSAIYHAILEHGDDIRLARIDQREAVLDEIPIPDPPAELVPWDPGARDLDIEHRERRDTRSREVYGDWARTPLVMEAEPDFGAAQVTARALEKAGMIDRVFNPIAAYHGYQWYDALERITAISVAATDDGGTTALLEDDDGEKQHDEPGEYVGATTRVDRITVTLHVADRCAGTRRDIVLETDAAFAENEPNGHQEIGLVLTRNARIDADDLARMMMRAFFSSSIDCDAESYGSQKEFHEVEYTRMAIDALESPASARTHYLETLARRHVAHRLLPGEKVTIECGGDSRPAIRVEVPPPEPGT